MDANPFNSKEFKEQVLGKGISEPESYEIIDDIPSCSVGPDSDGGCITSETTPTSSDVSESASIMSDLKSIISGAPTIPTKAAKNMILDASMIAKTEKEKKAAEIEVATNSVLTDFNKQYGLDVTMDIHSIVRTLALNGADERKMRILELYKSKLFRNSRTILSMHLIQRLYLLIDYVTSPEALLNSQELTLADRFLVIEKLITYIETLEGLKKNMEIAGDDLELKKLAEEGKEIDYDSKESKENIDDFMKLFNKEFTEGDNNK